MPALNPTGFSQTFRKNIFAQEPPRMLSRMLPGGYLFGRQPIFVFALAAALVTLNHPHLSLSSVLLSNDHTRPEHRSLFSKNCRYTVFTLFRYSCRGMAHNFRHFSRSVAPTLFYSLLVCRTVFRRQLRVTFQIRSLGPRRQT